jgi:hypothetical protein
MTARPEHDHRTHDHPETVGPTRKLLLIVLAVGLVGSAADLMLLGHYEDPWQIAPLVLICASLAMVGLLVMRCTPATIRAFRLTMILSVIAGALGMYLHFDGNRQFQHELDPSLRGWALFATVMTAKAPPALAPGAMIQLGLIGLVATYRHPAVTPSRGHI